MKDKKGCRENLKKIVLWNDKKYKLVKILSKGISASASFYSKGTGAYVYIIQEYKTKKKYILKYFNRESSRNKR